ncbi:MAG: FAD-dependent oxidoreductase [Bacillota bacterium]|nr:FAD-dependent oxidoreductase [Bacillota bacterium]
MKNADLLILGGSAAGLAAANAAYARFPKKKINIIRNVDYTVVPCGIPYIYGYLDNVEKDKIPDQGFLNKGMEITIGEVVDIDRTNKIVTLADGEQIQYEKLVFGLGSSPKFPPVEGTALKNVYPIKKDPVYLQQIYDALNAPDVKDVVVIGGGFIGVEMAEQIKLRGDYNVSLVEALPHCLMMTCEEFAGTRAEAELQTMGVNIMTNTMVKAINGADKVESVALSSGETLKADMVILGIGCGPNTDLAKKIGLDVDPKCGVKVDEYMCTSDPSIYSCGDCCTKFSAIDGTPSEARLASVAVLEGIIAGSNIFGNLRKHQGVVGSFCTKVGGVSIASAGLTEKQAQDKGMDYYTGSITAADRHPGALPGCTPNMEMKLLFEKGTDLAIGGHVAGGMQAGDMVNVIAVAIQNHLTADQIVASQFATHPLLTGSPLVYHVLWAAENAIVNRSK